MTKRYTVQTTDTIGIAAQVPRSDGTDVAWETLVPTDVGADPAGSAAQALIDANLYTDSSVQGEVPKGSARAALISTDLANLFGAGRAATYNIITKRITSVANAAIGTQDGVADLAVGQNVMVPGLLAAEAPFTGPYVITQLGSPILPVILTRTGNFNASIDIKEGSYVWLTDSACLHQGRYYLDTETPPGPGFIIDITPLSWVYRQDPQLGTAIPQPVGTAAVGASAYTSHEDHVHAHGNQLGGTLHANAVGGGVPIAGFQSGTDKVKEDNYPAAYTAGRVVRGSGAAYAESATTYPDDSTKGGVVTATADHVLGVLASPVTPSLVKHTGTSGTNLLAHLAIAGVGADANRLYAVDAAGTDVAIRSMTDLMHGNLSGGALHALMTAAAAGFTSPPVYDTWAAFIGGGYAPAVAFASVLVYITDAGMPSLWKCTLTGLGTYEWECIWSSWYLTTGTVPSASDLTRGVNCYDTTLGIHLICLQTAVGGWEWVPDARMNMPPMTWAALIALSPFSRMAGLKVSLLSYVDQATATQTLGLQGTVNLSGLAYPADFGVKTITFTIGVTPYLVTFANPADVAAVLTQINAIISAGGAVAEVNATYRLIVRSDKGIISATDGTLACATIGLVSGASHPGGNMTVECRTDESGGYSWQTVAGSTVYCTLATRPAVDVRLSGLTMQQADVGQPATWLLNPTEWECVWSGWYLITGSIPVAAALYRGVECYDSTLAVHLVCKATTAGAWAWVPVGSGSGTRCLRELLDPAGQNYDPGVNVLTTYVPPAWRTGLQFVFAKLPPKQGNVTAGIRVTFQTDAGAQTTVTQDNPLAGTTYIPDTSVDWNKSGQSMVKIEFIGTNSTGGGEVQDLGEFQVHGWWI